MNEHYVNSEDQKIIQNLFNVVYSQIAPFYNDIVIGIFAHLLSIETILTTIV